MGIKVLKKEDFLETQFEGYILQYYDDYELGNLRTNILDKESSELVKVIKSSKKSINNEEKWMTHVYDDKTKKIDMTWHPYPVNLEEDLIKKEIGGKEMIFLKMHEKILTVVLKDLAGLPIKEQLH
ncbi:MAG: hypothetical protein KKA65_04700 [Nanoarchaeota archaeon]|nr:hypothetical protein [Nanoarchaeota archaeon]MBU4241803.1 hypothetical protein [Nanoarchaeota archaeon]MBU4352317.1 hypothetical protein [Nanoarchaeota archaeon]MBU4456775.1 hypothetical protein [Nanoarchaeota archaeon]MCG2720166.1 hypothetical protein [Nanoarchaeota archaeon]